MDRRLYEEHIFRGLMYVSVAIVLCSLLAVFAIVVIKGASALNIAMVTQTPQGGYYLGKQGGILNAIIGSVYLSVGAILLAISISLPAAWYLQKFGRASKIAHAIRTMLDIASGIPSLLYGAFIFLIMIMFQARASLLWGIITVGIFIAPLLTRAFDEVMQMVPEKLKEASYSLGATRWETVFRVVTRQAFPGLITAVLVSFGRAIGDAASVLFTAGYTDSIPTSLGDPVATLPLAIFFQLSTPFPQVQERAYASGIILLAIVLIISLGSRYLSKRMAHYSIK
ncbi:phosphate ABC transporter permease PstA [Methanoregula formicica]|uniref:Phosphate transport system permease protein PstA n=1 Tax=Methanoregula formicica (strain DSM 22288 / NBRC 105244 / SMSP) TaxID=593750 RepID=L0HDU0_METFS|nr:phosphate ABC transporter permease PstA [Methanoregula formicica]AGB01498.1 phosphate ABC transporter, permease protein PstA [Methanoregula formicica SMSP]